MFRVRHPKRNDIERSIKRMKIGGYRIACHMVAALKIERLPKARNNISGEVLIKVSTIP